VAAVTTNLPEKPLKIFDKRCPGFNPWLKTAALKVDDCRVRQHRQAPLK
jgi:hypothetical protein